MAVPAKKPRKATLEDRRAEVKSERERMKEKTLEKRRESSTREEEDAWSDDDKRLVESRRREVMDEDWDDVPEDPENIDTPREWTDSIWLKIGFGVVVVVAFYVIFQGWG